MDAMNTFYTLLSSVLREERERCAKVCEALIAYDKHDPGASFAKAIRELQDDVAAMGIGDRRIDPEEMRDVAQPWIEWKGGKCPVDPECLVEVKCRDGWTGRRSACQWRWTWEQRDDDIIAYRKV